MTNYEKHYDEIFELAKNGDLCSSIERCRLETEVPPTTPNSRAECPHVDNDEVTCKQCVSRMLEWLRDEYKEPVVDRVMTNYEKYKDEFIERLATDAVTCSKIYRLRTNKKTCPLYSDPEACKECERLNKEWLEAEALVFDLEELEAGDKILMRKLGEKDAWLYEVVCNSFPALWLRFRASENGVHQAHDENFLIFYADLSDKYEIHKVMKND